MKPDTIQHRLLHSIQQKGRGTLVFPADYMELGNNDALRKAFSRFGKEKLLERLGPGIYLYPEIDKELGVLYPSAETIAEAIAQRDRARIIPTGVQAMYKLGLSTQIPMKIVYLTDGTPRKLKIGNSTINFKPTPPKKFDIKGKISSLVIQALQEMGQKQVDDTVMRQLEKLLEKEDRERLREDAKLAPVWISGLLFNFLNKTPS